MLQLENPVVGIGEPFAISFPDIDSAESTNVTSIKISIVSNTSGATQEFEIPAQRHFSISTDRLQPGSYRLEMLLIGTDKEFTFSVLVGVSNLHERTMLFLEALEIHRSARHMGGTERLETLRAVEQVYSELGLIEMTLNVKKEISPFEHRRADSPPSEAQGPGFGIRRRDPKQYLYVETGRRKEAVATAHVRIGSGKLSVSAEEGRVPLERYFDTIRQRRDVLRPLELTNLQSNFDILLVCSGGGKAGQAGASSLAIARMLRKFDETLRPVLKSEHLLTRDSRDRERKKYGLRGARKRPQFSKR